MTELKKASDPFAALRYKDYRRFVSAKFFLTVALQMQAVIMSWFIYEKTKDPLSLGLIGLVEAVPALSIALFGGHLADRLSRKKLIIWSTLLTFLACMFLVLVVRDLLHHQVTLVYVTIFLLLCTPEPLVKQSFSLAYYYKFIKYLAFYFVICMSLL